MEALKIKKNEDSPEIHFDKEKGIFEISGNSFSDNPYDVFDPVIKWLDEYIKDPNEETILNVKLNYVNTASSKQITDMIVKLEEIPEDKKVVVKWHYDRMDEDMEFEGETLKSFVDLDVELIGF